MKINSSFSIMLSSKSIPRAKEYNQHKDKRQKKVNIADNTKELLSFKIRKLEVVILLRTYLSQRIIFPKWIGKSSGVLSSPPLAPDLRNYQNVIGSYRFLCEFYIGVPSDHKLFLNILKFHGSWHEHDVSYGIFDCEVWFVILFLWHMW